MEAHDMGILKTAVLVLPAADGNAAPESQLCRDLHIGDRMDDEQKRENTGCRTYTFAAL